MFSTQFYSIWKHLNAIKFWIQKLKHLGLWFIKARPLPRAAGPPKIQEYKIDYSTSQLPEFTRRPVEGSNNVVTCRPGVSRGLPRLISGLEESSYCISRSLAETAIILEIDHFQVFVCKSEFSSASQTYDRIIK